MSRRDLIDWTEDRITALQSMWAAGASFKQIALEVGVSRNAVCTRCHKLGLRRDVSNSELHKQKPRGIAKPQGFARSVKIAAVPYVAPPPPIGEPNFLGPLQDIPKSGCRFPRGDWQLGTFQCCAHETGGPVETDPYCGFHRGICLNTVATDRANARARSKAA